MLVVVGFLLITLGLSMRVKQNYYTHIETEVQRGNEVQSTAIGATAGAVVGGAAGATLGGIGIAACGTGVGIPAGLVCLIGAGVCGLIGGGIGYAAGKPDETITTPITTFVSAYSPSEYWAVIIAGALLIVIGILLAVSIRKLTVKTGGSIAMSEA